MRPTIQLRRWQGRLLWVIGAALLGFMLAEVFSSLLKMPRDWFVAIYSVAIVAFVYTYLRWGRINFRRSFPRHWLARRAQWL
jgi:membrane protein DedA with SNARE-associated domain